MFLHGQHDDPPVIAPPRWEFGMNFDRGKLGWGGRDEKGYLILSIEMFLWVGLFVCVIFLFARVNMCVCVCWWVGGGVFLFFLLKCFFMVVFVCKVEYACLCLCLCLCTCPSFIFFSATAYVHVCQKHKLSL